MEVFHTILIRWLDVDLEEALSIAVDLEIYAYDAYMIAAARKQKFQRRRRQAYPCWR